MGLGSMGLGRTVGNTHVGVGMVLVQPLTHGFGCRSTHGCTHARLYYTPPPPSLLCSRALACDPSTPGLKPADEALQRPAKLGIPREAQEGRRIRKIEGEGTYRRDWRG